MNYTTIFVAFFTVPGVAATGLLSEYISKRGGVGDQKVLVYSEVSILDLSNRRTRCGKPLTDPCSGDIPER